jgi:hypothetical protein
VKFVGKLLSLLGVMFVYCSVATTVAQGVGIASLWVSGALTQGKVKKYAAVVYGFDLTELDFGDTNPTDAEPEEVMNGEELLESRVNANAMVAERRLAIKKGADDIRGLAQRLSTKRERYEIVKQGFNDLLAKLEQEAHTSALQEVQRTLEVLKPKQAKDLLMDMLQDDEIATDDDVLGDVLAIIRGMPQDKLKKVFGEFKSDEERSELHRVLVAIGEIDKR